MGLTVDDWLAMVFWLQSHPAYVLGGLFGGGIFIWAIRAVNGKRRPGAIR